METITESSGNIFKDLGFDNHEELKAKAELARQIAVSLELQGIKQKDAEKITGVHQGDISKIINGHCDRFTIDRLFGMLLKLGHNVRISIDSNLSKTSAHLYVA